MKIEFVSCNAPQADRLLLIFAGWGMDASPFQCLSRDGYDIAVVYDYTTGGLELPEGYKELVLLAWSYGVPAAVRFIIDNPGTLTKAIAVNGTPWPRDDARGIPAKLFDATLHGLCQRSITKFMMRMCGGMTGWKAFEPMAPRRSVDSLASELTAIGSASCLPDSCVNLFDAVYIADSDAIIPTASQLNAWSGHSRVIIMKDTPHLPDFRHIVDTEFISKPKVLDSFGNASATYADHADVQRGMAERLDRLWRETERSNEYGYIIEPGAGIGLFTECYTRGRKIGCIEQWDIAPHSTTDNIGNIIRRQLDAEIAVIGQMPDTADAIVSASTVQWFNSPLRFVQRCARVLKAGGMLVLSTFGPRNFEEITRISGSSLPYLSTDQWRDIIPDGMELLHCSDDIVVRRFDTPAQLAAHLRGTGVNATASGSLSIARRLLTLDSPQLTYHPVYIVARKKG